jgi:tetratricopeptide (TPR) repeat protein
MKPRATLPFTALAAVLLSAPLAAQPPAPAAPRPAPDSARQYQAVLAAAQAAMQEKNYAQCAAILENYLFEAGDSLASKAKSELSYRLAYCYQEAGRAADAEDMYRQTLELDPKSFPARFGLGLLFWNQKKPGRAAEELKLAVELKPDDPAAHSLLAEALLELGQEEEALEHFRRAAELDPKSTDSQKTLLSSQLERDDLEGAERTLQELRALLPDDPALLRLRAELLTRRGEDEAALAAYGEYLAKRPGDVGAHLQVARLCRKLGRVEPALQHYELASLTAVADPAVPLAIRERADLLVDADRGAEAVPLYQQLLRREPQNADLKAALGFALLQARQYAPAAAELQAALELDPARVEAYNHLASALYLNGDLPGALAALDRRAAHAPETPGTLFLRGISYDKLHQCASAIEFYEKFLATNPDTNSNSYFDATGRLRLLKKTCRERRAK